MVKVFGQTHKVNMKRSLAENLFEIFFATTKIDSTVDAVMQN